jgi:RND family efflux transporter MFP subunit
MRKGKVFSTTLSAALALGSVVYTSIGNSQESTAANQPIPTTKPVLSVTMVSPSAHSIPTTLTANGSIAAWQEAIIGAEVNGLHLVDVKVQVGDKVKKGQVLAVFADDDILIALAERRAELAEAEANLSEARLNANRARKVTAVGALSAQQIDQYLIGERTALAKMQFAKAHLDAELLRQRKTKVIASDDGIISARNATLGAVAIAGQELFRLIRQNRLEWRGEVTADEMVKLKPGLPVNVEVPNVGKVAGKIRILSPSLDAQTRNGLVYVDIPEAVANKLQVGMFAKGEFNLGNRSGVIVPQQAVSLREGFSYVFRIVGQAGDQAKVSQVKVQLGRRNNDDVEIISGVNTDDRLVADGISFLADGDAVKVVQP